MRTTKLALALAGLVLATGCPVQPPVVVGPAPPPPAPGAPPAPEGPAPLAETVSRARFAPVSYGSSRGTDAFFVRCSEIRAGGEFNTLTDELVHALVRVNDATCCVLDRLLDFPSAKLERFPLADAPWAELAGAEGELDLELVCGSSGKHGGTRIARLPAPVRIDASSFGDEDRPRTLTLALGPIKLTEYGLFTRTPVEIHGATATLELVRAPRRTERDATAAREVQRVFATAIPAEPAAIKSWLDAGAESAATAAGRSLHGYVRRTLPELAQLASEVAAVASRASSDSASRAERDELEAGIETLRARITRETAGAAAEPIAPPETPRPERAKWKEPTPTTSREGYPDSLAGPEKTPEVTFVRQARASLGGEFDDVDDEEIEVRVVLDGKSARLVYRVLDLPAGKLDTFEFDDADWVELPARDEWALGVQVREEDVTVWEPVTHSLAPSPVKRADVPLEKELSVDVPLDVIRLSEGALIFRKPVEIEDAQATLSLVRVPRREDRDDASRKAIDGAFGQLARTLPPKTDELEALGVRVEELAASARKLAGTSLHLRVRRVAAELGLACREVATLARGIAAAEPEGLERDRAACLALARKTLAGDEDKADLAKVEEALAKPRLDRSALEEGSRTVRFAGVAVHDRELDEALEAYSARLERAARGVGDARAKLDEAWRALHEKIAAER